MGNYIYGIFRNIDAQRLESMVRIIDELKPDLILFAGDIIEGSPTEAEARKLVAVFKQTHNFGGSPAH